MAYPFVQMPALGQFIRRVCGDYGCTREKGFVTLFGPDGKSRVSALSRGENCKRKVVVLPEEPEKPHVKICEEAPGDRRLYSVKFSVHWSGLHIPW